MTVKSKQSNLHRSSDLWMVLLAAFSAAVLLQASPGVVQTPGNDSGIFLHFGDQILKGKLPFVDLWDHKPPLLFYINALGLFLGGGSRWGVWALQVLSLCAASVTGFAYLRKYFGGWAAFLAVVGMQLNLAFVLEGGNLTEEFALPFQFAGLLLFAQTQGGQKPGWRGFAIGVLMAGAFLLKQTLIGAWVAMSAFLLAAAIFTGARQGMVMLAQMAAGFVFANLACTAYFAANGALAAYWDVAFRYNFIYSDASRADQIRSLLDVLVFLTTRSGFFLAAITAWAGALMFVLLNHEGTLWQVTRRRAGFVMLAGALVFLENGLFATPFHLFGAANMSPYRWGLVAVGAGLAALWVLGMTVFPWQKVYLWLKLRQFDAGSPVLLPVTLALIGLPFEMLMVSLSGRGYLHYYMSMLPPLTALAAFLAWSLGRQGRAENRTSMGGIWSAALLVPFAVGGLLKTVELIRPGADQQTTQTVAYIQENTQPDDMVLMWGTQTGIYFLSGRAAPTRFVHQYPIFHHRYASPDVVASFLSDLQTNKPALIIDTHLDTMPLVYGAGEGEACWKTELPVPDGMEQVYRFLCENYEPAGSLGKDAWTVYRYRPADGSTTGSGS